MITAHDSPILFNVLKYLLLLCEFCSGFIALTPCYFSIRNFRKGTLPAFKDGKPLNRATSPVSYWALFVFIMVTIPTLSLTIWYNMVKTLLGIE